MVVDVVARTWGVRKAKGRTEGNLILTAGQWYCPKDSSNTDQG